MFASKKSMWNADWRNDVITHGTCFSMFVYTRARFHRWLAEIWQPSWPGELEVEFKFQRRSCKLSFLFSLHHQSTLESLFTTCIWYWVQVIEHSSELICIQSVEPRCNEGPRGWENVFMIMRFCYVKVTLLLLRQNILLVIPRTLLCGGSLYWGSTVFEVRNFF